MSQEQSVHVSLKCQSWGSPNILAQHDCLPHDSQRPSTWTTQKPKNIQKNKLAMFLYFQSGLVPHLFPWSCLQLLLATLHSIPNWSLLLFFLSTISFVSPWVFFTLQSIFPSKYMSVVSFKAFLLLFNTNHKANTSRIPTKWYFKPSDVFCSTVSWDKHQLVLKYKMH